MSLQQVIEASRRFTERHFVWIWAVEWKWVMFLCVVFVIGLFFFSFCTEVTTSYGLRVNLTTTVLAFFVLSFSISTANYTEQGDSYDKQKEYLMNVYVKPYISNLPIKSIEIEFAEDIGSSNLFQVRARESEFSKLLYKADDVLMGSQKKIIYSFERKKLEEVDYFDVEYDLDKDEPLVLKGNYLENDLGHGINAGVYNGVIHAPNNFRLK
ncbi:hypothetical protein PaeCFBP13512_18440 [Paenibacillus sp. CFBP13512]|uniref:hypothetical protein n=1 Tax=Paenibacillus sp. CFBP13512 TaxID=2184007 RepID=UPI0010C0296B|nr:hypothetical protein [Paenibacillus sp. CFBP13512]TKJ87202.1 hypothetical protein PaeCFBP13512_18440 [Paenibacillus sp. CFBP13512]